MSQTQNLPLLKTGWLKKQGKHNSSNWKKRYFAIVGGLMWRYDKPPPSDKHVPSKGEIKLYNCKLSVDSSKRKFSIEDYMGKTHVFKAESAEELNAWVAAIQQASTINPSVRYHTMSMASIPLPSQNSSGPTANRASLTHSGSHPQMRTTPLPETNKHLSQSTGALPQQQQRGSTNANIAPVVYVTNPPIYQQPPQQGAYSNSIRLSQNAQYNPYAMQAYAPHLQSQAAYQYHQQGQHAYTPQAVYQQPQYAQQPYSPQQPAPQQQMPPQQYAPQQYQQPVPQPQFVAPPQTSPQSPYGAPSSTQQVAPQTPPQPQFVAPPQTSPQPTSPIAPATSPSPALYPSTPENSSAPPKLPTKHRPPSTPLPPPPMKGSAPPTNPAFNSSYPELFSYYALGSGFGAPATARRPSQPPPFESMEQTSNDELQLIQARMEQQKRSVEEQRLRRQIELELLREETERLRKQEEEERQRFEQEQQRLKHEQDRLQKNLQSYQSAPQPSAPENGETSPRGELTATQRKEIEEHQKKIHDAQRRIEQEYQKILELEQGQQILQQQELQLKHEEQLDQQNEQASSESSPTEVEKDPTEQLSKDIHTLKIDSDFKSQLESQLRHEIKAKLHRTLSTATIMKKPQHQEHSSEIPSAPFEFPVPSYMPDSLPQPAFEGPPKHNYNSYFSQSS